MKRILNFLALLIAFTSVFTLMVGCKDETVEEEPQYADFTVTVVDGIGNPISDVMVKFTNSNGESKTRVTDKNGLATLKNTLVTEYTVTLEQGMSSVTVTNDKYFMSSEVRQLKITLRDEDKITEIYGEVADGAYAYTVGVGEYTVVCDTNGKFYLIFYAYSKGIYKVSVSSSDNYATIGFYGIPMFVQADHKGSGEYDGKNFELIIQDADTPYVLGISGNAGQEANVAITRVGDAPFDPEYAPWTNVPATEEFTEVNLSGKTLTDIDLSDAYLGVYLGEDGRYYTNDGKAIYIRINSISQKEYLDVSLAFIAGLVDKNFGNNIGGYVYNEDGSFEAKYSFNDMISDYYDHCDANGVYYLTEELANAIKIHGECVGWWNPNSGNYLFGTDIINTNNAWLFLCCTAE